MLDLIINIFESIISWHLILNYSNIYFTYKSIICQGYNNKLALSIKQILKISCNLYIKFIDLFRAKKSL